MCRHQIFDPPTDIAHIAVAEHKDIVAESGNIRTDLRLPTCVMSFLQLCGSAIQVTSLDNAQTAFVLESWDFLYFQVCGTSTIGTEVIALRLPG